MSEIDIYKHIGQQSGQQSGQQMISDKEMTQELEERINRAIDFILTNILDDEEYPSCMYLEKEDNEKLLSILRGDK